MIIIGCSFAEKMINIRKAVLADFLHLPVKQIFTSEYGCNSYTDLSTDYLVLTEEEANAETKKQIWSFLNHFEPDFVNSHLKVKLPENELVKLLSDPCENCLLIFIAFMDDYDLFMNETIERYGRAYFLCYGDKKEYRVTFSGKEYCIYKLD